MKGLPIRHIHMCSFGRGRRWGWCLTNASTHSPAELMEQLEINEDEAPLMCQYISAGQ